MSDESNKVAMDAFSKIFLSKETGVNITALSVQTNMGIFSGRWFNNSMTGQKTLRGFDILFNTGTGIAKLRLIEQNPNKASEPGRRAAMGSKIMWIIDQRTNNFLASIENGKVIPGKIKGIAPVKQAQAVAAQPPPVQIPEEIHEFAGDPADEVLNYYGNEGLTEGHVSDEDWSW